MMKSTDKFLIGIVAAIVLLVIAALVISLSKPEETYQDQNTPESVVHDYLLALQKEDYPKAYSFISSTIKGYPRTAGKFAADIKNYQWSFRTIAETTFSINSDEVSITEKTASVVVGATRFGGNGLFESSQYYWTFEVELQRVKEEWKIKYSNYYFVSCWNNAGGCK